MRFHLRFSSEHLLRMFILEETLKFLFIIRDLVCPREKLDAASRSGQLKRCKAERGKSSWVCVRVCVLSTHSQATCCYMCHCNGTGCMYLGGLKRNTKIIYEDILPPGQESYPGLYTTKQDKPVLLLNCDDNRNSCPATHCAVAIPLRHQHSTLHGTVRVPHETIWWF
jgi:hypothetical protein